MIKYILFTLSVLVFLEVQAQLTPFEKGNKNVTATYAEIISYYKTLDLKSSLVTMKEVGETDANLPLHVVYVSSTPNTNFDKNKRPKNTTLIFINNGIHPGEPDGIDASMMLVRDIIDRKIVLPKNVLLAIIPIYNIGGCLNRSSNYRVDQNGPEEFGFRGNSQNLDLNRDFIKNDSKEAKSFANIYQQLQPQIFIDNHVSNGADYQHVMTLLTTQHNKLGGVMGEYINKIFEPALYALMKKKGFDLVPYVNFYGETPEDGWSAYYDSPRYSSGYAAMWHSFAFVPETHMLKPYWQRVDATYKLMECFINYTATNSKTINDLQEQSIANYMQSKSFPIDWKLDKAKKELMDFKGYTAEKKESKISGLPRLWYNKSKPFEKQVAFMNTYIPQLEVEKPTAYIIPQGWWRVIDLLKINKVKMMPLQKDTTIQVETYKIIDFKSSARAYESHHGNNSVMIEKKMKKILFRKGDWYIPMNQLANRFLMETLEPNASDSYFCWNFFDGITGQKEGFSNYVFEETAEQILKENPTIKKILEEKKNTDEKFAKDGAAQLDFIYKNSKYFEDTYMQYPVYRVL